MTWRRTGRGSRQAILTRWPEADETEVAAIDGDRAAFNAYLGRIEGLSPREAEEAIDEWLAGPMPADARMDATMDDANIRASRAHIRRARTSMPRTGASATTTWPSRRWGGGRRAQASEVTQRIVASSSLTEITLWPIAAS
jgi:hypothetical protein